MSAERVPYPELDCALAMSKALGNLNFLVIEPRKNGANPLPRR